MSNILNGKVFCWTGFRDANLKEQIESLGGVMKDSLTKSCNVLFCNIESSTKVLKAKQMGIEIVLYKDIKDYLSKLGVSSVELKDKAIKQKISVRVSDSMNEKVYTWYKKTFPDDDIVEDCPKTTTFQDVYNKPNAVYELTVGDSIFRERVFEEISNRANISYDDIYDAWLDDTPIKSSSSTVETITEITDKEDTTLTYKLNDIVYKCEGNEKYSFFKVIGIRDGSLILQEIMSKIFEQAGKQIIYKGEKYHIVNRVVQPTNVVYTNSIKTLLVESLKQQGFKLWDNKPIIL